MIPRSHPGQRLTVFCMIAALACAGSWWAVGVSAEPPLTAESPADTKVPESAKPFGGTKPTESAKPIGGTKPTGDSGAASSARGIPSVHAVIQAHIDSGEIAGAVALVGDQDRWTHLHASGFRSLAAQQPQKVDDLFAIASMTKPITATCVMMLHDDGRLDLDDPVSKYLPRFADVRLASGQRPSRELTIRDCLTHTAGLAGDQSFSGTLADAADEIASRKLAFEPGERWSYSPGLTVAGRIVEIVSNQSLETFMQSRLFGPLGMIDTTFLPTETQTDRVSQIYHRGKDGGPLTEDTNRYGKLSELAGANPSAGLYSTATDLYRFYRMILNQGRDRGRQIVSASSVSEMTSVCTGEMKTGFTPGNGWGLGWCVVRQPQGVSAMLSPGTFGHGGAFGTQAWIDPITRRVHLLMIQRTGMLNSDASEIRRHFQQAVADHFAVKAESGKAVAEPTRTGHWILLGAHQRLVLTDPSGQVRWEMPWGGIHDLHLLDDGHILTRQGKHKVVRIDPQTQQVTWTYDAAAADSEAVEIHAFDVLDDGRLVVAESGRCRIVLVHPDGSIDDEIPLTVDHPDLHSDTRLMRTTRDGGFLVAHERDGKARRYDHQGNVTWEFGVPLFGKPTAGGHGPDAFGNRLFAAIENERGNVWVTTGNGHSVLEVNPSGDIVWQLHQDDLAGIRLAWVTTIEATDRGTLLIGNCHAGPGQPVLVEVDPQTRRLVWQLDGHDRFGDHVSNSVRVPEERLGAFGIDP